MRLTPQQAELVNRLVSEGRYATPSEVISDGLQLLEREAVWKSDVRRKIAEGLEDVRNGKVVDGEKAIEEILDSLRRRQSRRKKKRA